MKQFSILLCIMAIIGFSTPAFSITITSMDSAEGLAQSLVGSGITISNISFTGTNVAAGYFSGGEAAGIGIEDGVVLTTGFASNLDGTTNTEDGITGENHVAGDSDLDELIPGTTLDATVLSFDFVSQGDAAYFNYVFGSEEYNEYVNEGFNDVFGFFVNDKNYALIPGTDDVAVSINNINNNSYSEYYHDNDLSDVNPTLPFEYDGFTDVFMASITGLTAGETYNIKLAIGDVGDSLLDSGVFLQAGSFSDKPAVPEPATMLLLGSGLIGLAVFGRKKRVLG